MRQGKKWVTGLYLLAGFIAFTLLLTVLDHRPVGPEGSYVGCATANAWFHELMGVHNFWYTVTNIFGYVSILIAAFFSALTGLEFIRKGCRLFKVKKSRLLLMGLYAVVFLIYVFFEFVVVNCRPILMEGELEASYPSSHTVLGLCVFGSLYPQARPFFGRKNNIKRIVRVVIVFFMFVMTAGRLISGVHWLTDVVGAVLLSAALLQIYYGLLYHIRKTAGKKKEA